IVKELGLKIEHAFTSFIVFAIRTSTRLLRIIRDLPIKIKDTYIPIIVEVVPATSYSLLLRNNLSKKIKANYNWANRCYSFKWNNKKYSTTTIYESTDLYSNN
ncbi:4004_t:CDS:1, partial [Scutellospora calospora]